MDEMTYLHGAWLISKGAVPFVDFELPHHPLVSYLCSLPFLIVPEGPVPILISRVLMASLFLSLIAALYVLSHRRKGLTVASLILMMALTAFTRHIIEIRPDSLSFLFYLALLAVVLTETGTPPTRGWLTGPLFGLCIVASIKGLAYGAAVYPALLWDIRERLTQKKPAYLLGHPQTFIAGLLGVIALTGIWLATSGAWEPFLVHSRANTGFLLAENQRNWLHEFLTYSLQNIWILALAVYEVIALTKNWLNQKPRLFLAASWLAAWISCAIQPKPFSYSFLPFWGMTGLLAGYALKRLINSPRWVSLGPTFRLGAGLAFIGGLGYSFVNNLSLIERATLSHQKYIWNLIPQLTHNKDVFFDNSGGFVFRPDTGRQFFRSAYNIDRKGRDLMPALVLQIKTTQCVAWMMDDRFKYLPMYVQKYFKENFVPYNGDLWFWGRKYSIKQKGLEKLSFEAIKSDSYFITPPQILDAASISIDGKKITQPVFHLEAGLHQIEYKGSPSNFHLIWLPRNKEPFTPIKNPRPKFSKLL